MPELQVHRNVPLQSHTVSNRQTRINSWNFGNLVLSPVLGLIEYGRYLWSPSPSPNNILSKISSAAERGLQRAKIRGVESEQITPKLHGDINELLAVRINAERTAAINSAQLGEVANLDRLMPDEEVTRAPQLQNREEARDWKQEIIIRKDSLSKKVTIFTTLLQMRDRCGCGKDEKNNLGLMELVKKATENKDNPPSVWELFTSRYEHELTLPQKFVAGWFYAFFYLTSLLGNTVEAYLGKFIEDISNDLTKESSETRTSVFRTLIENANQFLEEDNLATEHFANGKEHGSLKEYRNRAIERVYGFSLPDLCKAFSEHRVDKDSPTVPFLRSFQEIPVLGWPFQIFEWIVNRFLIQSSMKTSILPQALEGLVNKGLEATRQENLPFSISMTQFLTKRLEQLFTKIKTGMDSSPSKDKFPGTEMLPTTIKNLTLTLALQGATTPLELRNKFEQIKKNKSWNLDKTIADKIELAIVEAANKLFGYLHETVESGELFANLLELAEEPFFGKEKNPSLLLAEYKEEESKLRRTAKSVFEELIRKTFAERFYRKDTESSQKIAADLFDSQKIVINKTISSLKDVCDRMKDKIAQSQQEPKLENNVQTDITSLLQILHVLSSRKELQEELTNINEVDRNAIWRTLNPFIERTAKIQERILRLQELQDHYPSHHFVVHHLNVMNNLFKSIRDQFHTQPRHLQNSLIQPLGRTADEISKCLGAKAPLQIKLQGMIGEISRLTENIVKEQQIIDAIHALYPPRYNADDGEPEGLLDQLLNYERGVQPSGFKPKACLDEIKKYLAHFPPEEKHELEILIGNGSNLKMHWAALAEVLQKIYTKHMQIKYQDENLLDARLDADRDWIQEKVVKYTIVKEDDHSKMRSEMNAISMEVESLIKDSEYLMLNLPAALSPRVKQIANMLFPVAGALLPLTAGTYAGGWVASSVGSFAGGLFGKWWNGDSSLNKKTAAINQEPKDTVTVSVTKKIFITSLAGFVSYFLPAGWSRAGAAATAGYAGWNTVTTAQSIAEDRTYNQVMEIFNNAYDLMLNERIYKAATTRTLLAMTPASKIQGN
jgi:hypothetical protein